MSEPSNLEKLREVFLTGVDEETRADNLAMIRDWEKSLVENEAYQGWKEHDVTRRISAEARVSYVELATTLATRRDLNDAQRESIYAKQDAMLWLLSLTERDAAAAMKQIQADIARALQSVS